MGKYICVASDKEMFNVSGESLGMIGERALYYSKSVGKHRIYRSSYPLKPYIFRGKDINKDLNLLVFNTPKEAQNLCDEINNVYGDNFMIKEVSKNER